MASGKEDWAIGSLVETVAGPLYGWIDRDDDIAFNTRAIGNWYRCCFMFAAGVDLHTIRPLMSRSHEASFQLLRSWWTASYQDAAFSLSAILRYLSQCEDLSRIATDEEWQTTLRYLQLREWPLGDLEGPGEVPALVRRYHTAMSWLFWCEFGFSGGYEPSRERENNRSTRQSARREGLILAYCQKLAWKVHRRSDFHEDKVSMTQTSDNTDLGRLLLSNGPIFEPCSWLGMAQDQKAVLPFYLWDVAGAKTVETSTLSARPLYTTISHTWGRWIRDSPVAVQGVPWRVPQNKRFTVQNLPEILRKVPGNNPYVWFDLVCIPQEGHDMLKAQEISRQAMIFRGAQHVIAWLNDVHDFEGLHHIVAWMLLRLLQLQSPSLERRYLTATQDAWLRIRGHLSSLMDPRGDKPFFEYSELHPWFTSLWTLQEISLRPDMRLCTKDWAYLALDGDVPLPLSGLIAVFDTFSREDGIDTMKHIMPAMKTGNQDYLGIFELNHWRFRSGLERLLRLDRISLLSLGDRRECKERRAEAIMSAFGVTDWYDALVEEADKQAKPYEALSQALEQNLVLGKFPLAFVNELREKSPADFFGAFMRMNIDTSMPSSQIEPPGTMLPFGSGMSYCAEVSAFRQTGVVASATHESVLTWRVLETGQVHMPQACIISSLAHSQQDPLPLIPAGLTAIKDDNAPFLEGFVPKWGDDGIDYRKFFDLHRWIAAQEQETYAVLIEYRWVEPKSGSEMQVLQAAGLIIERTTTGGLVKKTHFMIHDVHNIVDLREIVHSDWIID